MRINVLLILRYKMLDFLHEHFCFVLTLLTSDSIKVISFAEKREILIKVVDVLDWYSNEARKADFTTLTVRRSTLVFRI